MVQWVKALDFNPVKQASNHTVTHLSHGWQLTGRSDIQPDLIPYARETFYFTRGHDQTLITMEDTTLHTVSGDSRKFQLGWGPK